MVTQEATPAKAKPTRIRMSYEEFREWADEDTHAQIKAGLQKSDK